jgi:hypothetical protein
MTFFILRHAAPCCPPPKRGDIGVQKVSKLTFSRLRRASVRGCGPEPFSRALRTNLYHLVNACPRNREIRQMPEILHPNTISPREIQKRSFQLFSAGCPARIWTIFGRFGISLPPNKREIQVKTNLLDPEELATLPPGGTMMATASPCRCPPREPAHESSRSPSRARGAPPSALAASRTFRSSKPA